MSQFGFLLKSIILIKVPGWKHTSTYTLKQSQAKLCTLWIHFRDGCLASIWGSYLKWRTQTGSHDQLFIGYFCCSFCRCPRATLKALLMTESWKKTCCSSFLSAHFPVPLHSSCHNNQHKTRSSRWNGTLAEKKTKRLDRCMSYELHWEIAAQFVPAHIINTQL